MKMTATTSRSSSSRITSCEEMKALEEFDFFGGVFGFWFLLLLLLLLHQWKEARSFADHRSLENEMGVGI